MIPAITDDTSSVAATMDRPLRLPYEAPEMLDFGSIAEHTFLRCGGTTPNGGGKIPPKDFPFPPVYHLDRFGECSALAVAVSP